MSDTTDMRDQAAVLNGGPMDGLLVANRGRPMAVVRQGAFGGGEPLWWLYVPTQGETERDVEGQGRTRVAVLAYHGPIEVGAYVG
jgi:hypothetical protein